MRWSRRPDPRKLEPRRAVFANKAPRSATPAWLAKPAPQEPTPTYQGVRFTLPPTSATEARQPSQRPPSVAPVPPSAPPSQALPAHEHVQPPPPRPSAEEEEHLAALRQALADIGSLRELIFSQTERQLVELAVTIARQVIAREIALDPSVLIDLAREGIRALDERDKIVVRVGAALDNGLRDAFTEALRKDAPRCEVVVDPGLGPRECIVETELGRVDESIESRLYHVLEALLP